LSARPLPPLFSLPSTTHPLLGWITKYANAHANAHAELQKEGTVFRKRAHTIFQTQFLLQRRQVSPWQPHPASPQAFYTLPSSPLSKPLFMHSEIDTPPQVSPPPQDEMHKDEAADENTTATPAGTSMKRLHSMGVGWFRISGAIVLNGIAKVLLCAIKRTSKCDLSTAKKAAELCVIAPVKHTAPNPSVTLLGFHFMNTGERCATHQNIWTS
jgi:hypothetical protein